MSQTSYQAALPRDTYSQREYTEIIPLSSPPVKPFSGFSSFFSVVFELIPLSPRDIDK